MSKETKEAILDRYYLPGMHWKVVNRKRVLEAMEEFALIEKTKLLNEIIEKRKRGKK